MEKLCRICYNDKGWLIPSGIAGEFESDRSFTSEFGYGHEEWLLNPAFTVDGWQYGRIEGFSVNAKPPKMNSEDWNIYKSNGGTVYLYTFTPNSQSYLVATISELFAIDHEESLRIASDPSIKYALASIEENHNEGGMHPINILSDKSLDLFNVKFKFKNVKQFGNSLVAIKPKSFYYNAQTWDPGLLQEPLLAPENETPIEMPFQKGLHKHYQRLIKNWLIKKFPDGDVRLEEDYVDVKLRLNGGVKTYFFELKTNPITQYAIREALGQILEYNHYPRENFDKRIIGINRANTLHLLGLSKPEASDNAYMETLRSYRLKVFYHQVLPSGEIVDFPPKVKAQN
jgi:hypothetical protein